MNPDDGQDDVPDPRIEKSCVPLTSCTWNPCTQAYHQLLCLSTRVKLGKTLKKKSSLLGLTLDEYLGHAHTCFKHSHTVDELN